MNGTVAKDPGPRKEWLDGQCRELKTLGPKNLLETVAKIDWKSIRKREAKKTARREATFRKGLLPDGGDPCRR